MLPLRRRRRSPDGPHHRRRRDAGLGRAAVVLGRQVLSPQGALLTLAIDRRAARRRVVRPHVHPAGAARDAGDHGRPRHARQLRVPAARASTRSARTSSTACAAARCCASPAASRSRSSTCGRHRGHELGAPITPEQLQLRRRRRSSFRSYFPQDQLPTDPTGHVGVRDVHRRRSARRHSQVRGRRRRHVDEPAAHRLGRQIARARGSRLRRERAGVREVVEAERRAEVEVACAA